MAECQAYVSSSEFVHWMALDAIEPLPDRRLDYYLAQLALMAGNRWRPEKAPAYELSDFLMFQERPAPSPEDVDDRVRRVFGALANQKAP